MWDQQRAISTTPNMMRERWAQTAKPARGVVTRGPLTSPPSARAGRGQARGDQPGRARPEPHRVRRRCWPPPGPHAARNGHQMIDTGAGQRLPSADADLPGLRPAPARLPPALLLVSPPAPRPARPRSGPDASRSIEIGTRAGVDQGQVTVIRGITRGDDAPPEQLSVRDQDPPGLPKPWGESNPTPEGAPSPTRRAEL